MPILARNGASVAYETVADCWPVSRSAASTSLESALVAMASVPSFDPNYFIPSIASEDWERYVSDPTNPLVNRAIKDFPPGSTFKIPIALAGCFAGVGGRSLYCNGG